MLEHVQNLPGRGGTEFKQLPLSQPNQKLRSWDGDFALWDRSAPRTKFLAPQSAYGHQINHGYDKRHHGLTTRRCLVLWQLFSFSFQHTEDDDDHRTCGSEAASSSPQGLQFHPLISNGTRTARCGVLPLPKPDHLLGNDQKFYGMPSQTEGQHVRAGEDPKNASSHIVTFCVLFLLTLASIGPTITGPKLGWLKGPLHFQELLPVHDSSQPTISGRPGFGP
eukprot:s71_g13.t1